MNGVGRQLEVSAIYKITKYYFLPKIKNQNCNSSTLTTEGTALFPFFRHNPLT